MSLSLRAFSLMQCAARVASAPTPWHFGRTIVNLDGSSDWLLRVKYDRRDAEEHRMPAAAADWRVETVQLKQCLGVQGLKPDREDVPLFFAKCVSSTTTNEYC